MIHLEYDSATRSCESADNHSSTVMRTDNPTQYED